MDTQRHDRSAKKPLSGASKKPDAFWDLIVPSTRPGKERLDLTTKAHPRYPQINHAGRQKRTQAVDRTEKPTPHAIARANTTRPQPYHSVMTNGTTVVKRRAKGKPSTRTNHSSVAESLKSTRAQPVICREKRSIIPTNIVQPARPYISLGEMFKRLQAVESDEHPEDGERSGFQYWDLTSALHKRDEDEESSEGPDDTEGSDSNEDDVEDDNEDGGETASYASGLTTQRSQLSIVIPQRASAKAQGLRGKSLKEPCEPTAPKQKTAPSQAASVKGRSPRKRVKLMDEESDEASHEEEDEEEYEEYEDEDEGEDDGEYEDGDEEEYEDEEKAAARSVPHKATRLAKPRAQRPNLSISPALPQLSRRYRPWTKNEDETLFSLRNQGNNFRYIGENVLGRTAKAANHRWDLLRSESKKPVEARAKGRRGRQISSLVKMMPNIPKMYRPWSKEEDEKMIRLRTQGKSITQISRRMPGRGYGGCEFHWRKIKDQYPQAVKASKNPKSTGKGDPSERWDPHLSSASQTDQEVKEA